MAEKNTADAQLAAAGRGGSVPGAESGTWMVADYTLTCMAAGIFPMHQGEYEID